MTCLTDTALTKRSTFVQFCFDKSKVFVLIIVPIHFRAMNLVNFVHIAWQGNKHK